MSVILKYPRNDDNNFWNFAAEIGHMAATSKYTLVQFSGHNGYGDIISDIRLAKLHLYCNETGKVLAKLKTKSPILADYSVSSNKIISLLEKTPFSDLIDFLILKLLILFKFREGYSVVDYWFTIFDYGEKTFCAIVGTSLDIYEIRQDVSENLPDPIFHFHLVNRIAIAAACRVTIVSTNHRDRVDKYTIFRFSGIFDLSPTSMGRKLVNS